MMTPIHLMPLPLRVGVFSSYRPAIFFPCRNRHLSHREPDDKVKTLIAHGWRITSGLLPLDRGTPAVRRMGDESFLAFARHRTFLRLGRIAFAEVLLLLEWGFHSCRRAGDDGLPNATRMIKGLIPFVAYPMEPACRGPDRIHITSYLMVNQSGATRPPQGGFLI